MANAEPKNQKAIYDFGINLGMAFQLQDDIFDCYGDVNVFGKMTGGDIADNKKTYLYLKVGDNSFTARVNPRSTAKVEDTIKIGVDLNKIHLFDKETEVSILN